MMSIEGITLVPVDEPKEEGFYIRYNHVLWGKSTTVIRVNEGLNSITELGHSGSFAIVGDLHNSHKTNDEYFQRYKWIHIQIKKPQTNVPSESGWYWVWRDGCLADKLMIYYHADGGYYKTIGETASFSVVNIQEFNWKKVSEPEV